MFDDINFTLMVAKRTCFGPSVKLQFYIGRNRAGGSTVTTT